MKNIIDAFVTQFGIDTTDLKSKSKEVNKIFEGLEKRAQKAGESVQKSFDWGTFTGGKPEKNNKQIEKSAKNIDKLSKSVSNFKDVYSSFGRILKFIAPEALAGFAVGSMTSFVTKMAAQATPYYFNAGRLNTSVSNMSALGQAINLTGGSATNILGALGTISSAQTQTRLFGNSAINPYLYALGVPLSNNGTARKPMDVLLGISNALQTDIKGKRITRQDAYNILGMMGFSSDVANFLMQGKSAIEAEIRKEQLNPNLTSSEVAEFKKVTAASGEMANAFQKLEYNIAYLFSPAIIKFYNLMTSIFNVSSKLLSDKKYQNQKASSLNKVLNANGSNSLAPSIANYLLPNLSTKGGIGYLIGKGESNNNYSAYNSGTQDNFGIIGHSGTNKKLTSMSLTQLMALQAQTKNESALNPGRVFAVGRYQFTPSTLKSLISKYHINPNMIFNKATQDMLFNLMINEDAHDYITGKTKSPVAAIGRIRNDWTSTQKWTNSEMVYYLNMNRDAYLRKKQDVSNNNHTHIGTINIHTQSNDAPGLAKAIREHMSYITPMTANSGLS